MKKLIFSLLTILSTYTQCLPAPEQPVLTATVNDKSCDKDNDSDDDGNDNDTDDTSEEERIRNATELNVRVKAYVKKKRTDAFRRAITEGEADSLMNILRGHFDYGLCPSQQADINEDWDGKKPIEVALNLLIHRAKEYKALSLLGKCKSFLVDEPWIKREECYDEAAPHWQALFCKMKAAQILLNDKNLDLSTTRLNLSDTQVKECLAHIRTCWLRGYDNNNQAIEKFVHEAHTGRYDCLLTTADHE